MLTTEDLPRPAVSTEQFAEEVIAGLHRSIIVQEVGALAGDVEAIHDMRVAIRRLRVALSNFPFHLSLEERRRVRAQLEELAGALGRVRDLDVMIATFKDLLNKRPAGDRHAIISLIRRLQRRRRRGYLKLVDFLSSEEYANFKRELPRGEKHLEGQPMQAKDENAHGQAA